MAFVQFTDGTGVNVSAEKGLMIWDVLTGKVEPTAEQERFILKVNKICLDWRTAPDDYIERHLDTIKDSAINEWMVSRNGTPTRPADDFGWKFAKKWGLQKYMRHLNA